MKRTRSTRFKLFCIVCLVCLLAPIAAQAEEEVSSPYYDSLLYSELAPILNQIAATSNRVDVRVVGKSAGGRDLYLAVIAAPGAHGRLGHYLKLRRLMLTDPEEAQRKIAEFDDFKVPVFINASIHGNEYTGTDAAIRLIQQLAYDNSDAVKEILDNLIILVNVIANPDGRVLGTRQNSAGFDLNRDLMTQSQPETLALVQMVRDWNPMVFLDLHGFVNPMLIEPCTPPHNPNYEYDLYLTWAYAQALAMEAELVNQLGDEGVTGARIPYRDWDGGWDDWAPIYAAMYPMLHGAYGHTLETPFRDARGVDAHYAVVWGALNFVVQNKKDMVHDQIEIYRRGLLDLPQALIPDYLLAETPYEQYNEMTIKDFPTGYVIPSIAPFQDNPEMASEFVDFLLFNGVKVDISVAPIFHNRKVYPPGTYVVWMDQAKRGLANTFLEDGLDVSEIEGLSFYSPPSTWSQPLLWGISRDAIWEDFRAWTVPINHAIPFKGHVVPGLGKYFAIKADTTGAFQAVNHLLAENVTVYRATKSFRYLLQDFDAGTFLFKTSKSVANKLSKDYSIKTYQLLKMPKKIMQMKQQRVLAYGSEGLMRCLQDLGFSYDKVTSSQLNAGADLSGYDVLVFEDLSWSRYLRSGAVSAINAFVAAGGDFVGLGVGGVEYARENGFYDFDFEEGDGNGIVKMKYDSSTMLGGGYDNNSYAFIYYPAWFTRLGAGMKAAARISTGDFFVSGYWPEWGFSGAAGAPIVVQGEKDDQDTILLGIDAVFRGHPKDSFRLVGNAIFCGIDD